jgi:hypothetical protein
MIVRTMLSGIPSIAFTGSLKVRLIVSLGSLVLSSMMVTLKLWLVVPGGKVRVPLVAV